MTDREKEAHELVRRMKEATSRDEIAEIMVGASIGAFMLIDEKPGLFDPHPYDGDWFAWLRQLRNSVDVDYSLFDHFRKETG